MPSNQRAELNPAHSHNGSKKPSQSAGTSTILHAGKLKALYAAMVKCRMLEERLAAHTRRSLRTTDEGSLFGEEALLVGAALDLLPGDFVAPSQRAPLANFIQGTPLSKILTTSAGDADSMPGCGLGLGIATGLALTFKTQKQSHVVLCLMGKGPLASSLRKEALAFAGKHKLPVVYLVQTRSFANRVPGGGAPEIVVDGSDVVAVYRVMQEAIRHARQGYGPTLVEGILRGKDPIDFMEKYLRVRGLWSDGWNEKLKARFRAELQRASRKR